MSDLCEYCEESQVVRDNACQSCLDYFDDEDANRTCLIVGCKEKVPVGYDFCKTHGKEMRHAIPLK